jgi:hypothetical protein
VLVLMRSFLWQWVTVAICSTHYLTLSHADSVDGLCSHPVCGPSWPSDQPSCTTCVKPECQHGWTEVYDLVSYLLLLHLLFLFMLSSYFVHLLIIAQSSLVVQGSWQVCNSYLSFSVWLPFFWLRLYLGHSSLNRAGIKGGLYMDVIFSPAWCPLSFLDPWLVFCWFSVE